MPLANQLEKLKNDKYQLTPQRRAVLQALNNTMRSTLQLKKYIPKQRSIIQILDWLQSIGP